MKRNILVALLSTLWVVPLTSYGGGFMPWTDLIIQVDEDGDGAMTMQEIERYKEHKDITGFYPFMLNHFDELDANGDKMISMYEIKKGTMKMGMTDAEVSTGFNRGFIFAPK